MVFRFEATWKERDAITRRFWRHRVSFKLSRRGEQRRAARAKNRHESSAEARGSSAGLSGGQRAKDSRGQCAKGQKSQKRPTPSWRRVAAVNRLFTQVRHTSSWLGKSYLNNNSRSFDWLQSLRKTRAPNTFGRQTPGVVVSRAFLADVPHAGSSSRGPRDEYLCCVRSGVRSMFGFV